VQKSAVPCGFEECSEEIVQNHGGAETEGGLNVFFCGLGQWKGRATADGNWEIGGRSWSLQVLAREKATFSEKWRRGDLGRAWRGSKRGHGMDVGWVPRVTQWRGKPKVDIGGTGWNHEEREAHEGGRAGARKIRFGGTVQKSAVPCGFGECTVQIAECKMGRRRGSVAGANVDCNGFKDFLKSFRERPGKSGISSTCVRLNRVKKGRDG
jgi:hypothetical protein